MFSRIFSRHKDIKGQGQEPRSEQLGGAGRSPSPPTTESASISLSAATGAPGSPTRVLLPASRSSSPALDGEVNRAALQAILATCPAKVLQDFMLARLPTASSSELRELAAFFAEFEPPQQLHCVRCHKSYFEVENDDHSCTMPHDDDSAEVEHVGYGKRGAAGAYETRWDCCGRIVDGDGDLGPPSGWCYEGKHTIDRKRARYRNDSTLANDLLQSCEKRGCHRQRMRVEVVIPDDARSTRSVRSARSGHARTQTRTNVDGEKLKKRPPQKRTQKAIEDGSEGRTEQEQESKKKKRKVA